MRLSILGSGWNVLGSVMVEEHGHQCQKEQHGAEEERPVEPDGGDHEPEGEGAYAGPRVEGGVPERAAEPELGFGDAFHHQDQAGVLEQSEPGSEEYGPRQHWCVPEGEPGYAGRADDEARGEQEARVPAVAEASAPPA